MNARAIQNSSDLHSPLATYSSMAVVMRGGRERDPGEETEIRKFVLLLITC